MISYEYLDVMFTRLQAAREMHCRLMDRSSKPFPDKESSNAHERLVDAAHANVCAIECSIIDYLEAHEGEK